MLISRGPQKLLAGSIPVLSSIMLKVAQLVEFWLVAPEVAGSYPVLQPISHPKCRAILNKVRPWSSAFFVGIFVDICCQFANLLLYFQYLTVKPKQINYPTGKPGEIGGNFDFIVD